MSGSPSIAEFERLLAERGEPHAPLPCGCCAFRCPRCAGLAVFGNRACRFGAPDDPRHRRLAEEWVADPWWTIRPSEDEEEAGGA